jgi:hypothetical protein
MFNSIGLKIFQLSMYLIVIIYLHILLMLGILNISTLCLKGVIIYCKLFLFTVKLLLLLKHLLN